MTKRVVDCNQNCWQSIWTLRHLDKFDLTQMVIKIWKKPSSSNGCHNQR